jgi:hypothetical protein
MKFALVIPLIRHAATLIASAVPGIALAVGPAIADPPGRYDGYRDGAYLPYVNAPGPRDSLVAVPRLRISFGGRGYGVVMDTGSTGIVVSADKIPRIDTLPSLGPGTLTYSSSGRVMRGQWVVTPVTVAGSTGTSITTAPIPVLAVTRVECTQSARRCRPNAAPRGISMLGIGFARRHDHQPQSGPDKNPFLNVARIAGSDGAAQSMRRGYIVTRRGVHVGLTAANTQGEFSYVKLARATNDQDWAPTPACISVNDAKPAACGTLLMDTGVTTMYLTVPDGQAPADIRTSNGRSSTFVMGTKVAIAVPAEDSPQALYAFTLGDGANPLAPAALDLVGRTRAPFVNTSLGFLNGFDYLYDGDGGFVGFRWTGHAPRAFGKVVLPTGSPSN